MRYRLRSWCMSDRGSTNRDWVQSERGTLSLASEPKHKLESPTTTPPTTTLSQATAPGDFKCNSGILPGEEEGCSCE